MHVHNHPTNLNAVDLSSSRAAEKAASAQQAANVHRKLMKGGLDIEPFESFMVSNEPENGSRQRQGQDQKQNYDNTAERLQPAVEEQTDQPLSFWA